MESSTKVEDILSDDYEEGEILDEDNLYDDVSSLEEFSAGEEGPDKVHLKDCLIENNVEKARNCCKHRRKEHKCKDGSVCRKERKGKHCYARIRKSSSKSKQLIPEALPQRSLERIFPRKPDVTAVIKHLKSRALSPYKKRTNHPKLSPRRCFKDYREKENQYKNRCRKIPPRIKLKPPKKFVYSINRNKVNRDHNSTKYRHRTSPPPPSKSSCETLGNDELCQSDSSLLKTSLLKRLVGSGSAGVKSIKEDETSVPAQNSEGCPDKIITGVGPADPSESLSEIPPLGKNCTNSTLIVENYEDSKKDVKPTTPTQQIEEALPKPANKIELKWIRSIKEDKYELQLRVEALRSAWVKKFNDRKKKGLICQKKTEDSDDLEDFALGSDVEDKSSDAVERCQSNAESNMVNHFNATDISGDILKPEDMVIVNDKTSEEQIISETPVTTAEGNSSVYVDPFFFSGRQHYTHDVKVTNSLCHNSFTFNKSHFNGVNNVGASEGIWLQKIGIKKTDVKQVSLDHNLNENNFPNSSSRRLKKLRNRKRRGSKGMSGVTKNVVNTSTDLDEEVLREIALQSFKSKNKSVIPTNGNNESNYKRLGEIQSVSENRPGAISNPVPQKSACQDTCEEDLDEEALREKLLISLNKQVSEDIAKVDRELEDSTKVDRELEDSTKVDRLVAPLELKPIQHNIKTSVFKPDIYKLNVNLSKPPALKKQTTKKLDRRKLRNNANKKYWKQFNSPTKLRTAESVNMNRFKKSNFYKKPDIMVNHTTIPQVEKMIIKLDDSDSSSDLEIFDPNPSESLKVNNPIAADIETNIDLLLEEAKLNSQLAKHEKDCSRASKQSGKDKAENVNKMSETEKSMSSFDMLPLETTKAVNKMQLISLNSSNSTATPQALKHLPAWQQEEYKRLKKKIAEKEKVLHVTRSKIIEPLKDIRIVNNNPIPLGEKVTIGSAEVKQTANSQHLENSSVLTSLGSEKHPLVSDVRKPNIFEYNLTEEKCSAEENNSVMKKDFQSLLCCTIMEEINVMNDIFSDFEKNNSEYTDLQQKIVRLKRILKASESRLASKERRMDQIRDSITEKQRQISSKLSTFLMSNTTTPNDKNKILSRDAELLKFKYKEASLRAEFLFRDKVLPAGANEKVTESCFQQPELKSTKNLPAIGVKRLSSSQEKMPLSKKLANKDLPIFNSAETALPSKESKMKRNFSGKERERGDWDPNTPVCHYDLNGICRDEECKYQHFKTV